MKRGLTGKYVACTTVGEKCQAFIPNILPPIPEIEIGGKLFNLLEDALLALGTLNGLKNTLPGTSLFLYMYIRKEAILSSQIEGTQSSLSDLLLHESEQVPGVLIDDVLEVSRYISAMEHGLKRIRDGFPISSRLLREVHRILLSDGRGSDKNPGEYKKIQNRIGGTSFSNARFIPAPPEYVDELMSNLEQYIHDEHIKVPTLIKAAVAHLQFETIHPFLDGNGRLGRLLITLLLCAEGKLREPILYLSLYFKANRQEYYDYLQQVRLDGNWEKWLDFFLTGVRDTSLQANETGKKLMSLFETNGNTLKTHGRSSGSLLRVHSCLQKYPVATIKMIAKETKLAHQTISTALQSMIKLSIVREITDQRRNRRFVYDKYMNILSEGTEPIG